MRLLKTGGSRNLSLVWPTAVVTACPPTAPHLIISIRPCLMMAALELGPYPSPSTMPAAIATMHFSVPHISAPGYSEKGPRVSKAASTHLVSL